MVTLSPQTFSVYGTATCPSGLVVGDLVFESGAKVGAVYTVDKADPTALATMPAIGIVIAKPSATVAQIQFSGEVAYSGLTTGRVLFVGADGRASLTPPTGTRVYFQSIGVALSSTSIQLDFSKDLKVYVS